MLIEETPELSGLEELLVHGCKPTEDYDFALFGQAITMHLPLLRKIEWSFDRVRSRRERPPSIRQFQRSPVSETPHRRYAINHAAPIQQ
jgi:hypothetical protein